MSDVWRFEPYSPLMGWLTLNGGQVGQMYNADGEKIAAAMNAFPKLLEAVESASDALGKAGLTAEGTRGAMALKKIEEATAIASLYPNGGH